MKVLTKHFLLIITISFNLISCTNKYEDRTPFLVTLYYTGYSKKLYTITGSKLEVRRFTTPDNEIENSEVIFSKTIAQDTLINKIKSIRFDTLKNGYSLEKCSIKSNYYIYTFQNDTLKKEIYVDDVHVDELYPIVQIIEKNVVTSDDSLHYDKEYFLAIEKACEEGDYEAWKRARNGKN